MRHGMTLDLHRTRTPARSSAHANLRSNLQEKCLKETLARISIRTMKISRNVVVAVYCAAKPEAGLPDQKPTGMSQISGREGSRNGGKPTG